MKRSFHLWQSLITIILIVGSIWLYDRYFQSIKVIEQHENGFSEVSLAERAQYRWENFRSSAPTDFIDAAAKSKSSVVYITSYEKVNNSRFTEEFRREKGSGVIISEEGYIVTNDHVIANAEYIEIMLDDKREYIAEVVGSDPATDLALLKIEARGLPSLIFANSDSLQVGEWILAVGNPFGLQSTVTAGIVSAKARNIDALNKNDIESFIQSDAVINPGSSGGALVNSSGLLMGICTAIISKSGNYEGLSFFIPSNLARKVIVDLKEFGAVQRGKIGISITDVNADLARKANLPFIKGVSISSINLNSAAVGAGLKKRDVITSIDNFPVNSTSEFYEALNKFRPGDEINIVYYRKGIKDSTNLILRNYLNTTDFITVRNDKILRDLGIEIRNLNSIEKSRIKTEGVMIISVSKGSTIDETRMEPGYIVEYFNNIKISNVQEFLVLLKSSNSQITLKGIYERYSGVFPYSFELPE